MLLLTEWSYEPVKMRSFCVAMLDTSFSFTQVASILLIIKEFCDCNLNIFFID